MRKSILQLILVILAYSLNGQSDFIIKGEVIDEQTKAPIEFADVLITSQIDDGFITGTSTLENGRFEITSTQTSVYVEVRFIGYEDIRIENVQFQNNQADLGVIEMSESSLMLEDVTVTAERSTTEFKLDKRVFNVGSDLSSTGAGALEVLNNVPSVNVSIEGEVSLRGSTGVQMLINGKPSILADQAGNALGSITADMIEKIEVVTNPSAKYVAEGTAGIINIVLKKEEKRGINGSVSLNTGVPHNHSIGFSINRRTEKFNLFTQMGVGYRELPNESENINRNLATGFELLSTGEEFRNEQFYNIVLGADYYIDPLNIITLSGSFAYEIEDQPSETAFLLSEIDEDDLEWSRLEQTEATNPKLQYELQYKREFEDNEDHQLLFSAIGNYFGKDQSSLFSHNDIVGVSNQSDQTTATSFEEGKFTFNLDYTKPFEEGWTIETGLQYVFNDVNNDFEVSNLVNGVFVVDEGLTNEFQWNQNVLGVYGTTAYEGDIWGVKLGLRAENTDLATLLVNNSEANDQNFTNLFPSAHTSYKWSDAISFQAGYSRRIYRPRLWDLNPFFNIRNNFSVRAGNPELLPEFTDSYEVGSIFIFDKISFNTNVYHRYTTDRIERVSTFVDNVNIFKPENIGTNAATGVELNFKYTPHKKWTFNGDMNYNVFDRKGTFGDQNFDFSADQWSTKLRTQLKVSKALDTEVTIQHNSSEQTIQGERAAQTFTDLGVRYKVAKGKVVLNFSVRDLFASRVRQTTVDQEDFFLFSSRLRGRFITFGLSYGFGKGEAMTYSGRRR